MKALDRFLRNWRHNKALRFVTGNCLDVGCHDGSFLLKLEPGKHLGIDKETKFSEFKNESTFQTLSCLAAYEHFDSLERNHFWEMANKNLDEQGQVVMTIPHAYVDHILHWGIKLNILEGMDVHEHKEVKKSDLMSEAKKNDFRLVNYQWFQLGLNRLYVFKKIVNEGQRL